MLDSTSIDYRISFDQLAFINIDDLKCFDSITLGHTSCIHKLLDENLIERIEWLTKKIKRVRIEIPVIFGTHLQLIKPLLEELLTLSVDIVVNDWGILGFLTTINVDKKPIGIGRAMTMGMSSSPWSDDVFDLETNDVKNAWQEIPLDSDIFVELLKENNVTSIDLSIFSADEFFIKNLTDLGFEIFCFDGGAITSISRVCAFQKFGHTVKGECQHLCRAPAELSTKERWNRFDGTFSSIEKKSVEKIGVLEVYGNVTYRRNKRLDDSNLRHIKLISIDGRFREQQNRK